MKTLLWATFLTEALFFFSTLSFASRTNTNAQLLLMLSSLILFVLCLAVFASLFPSKNKPYRVKLAGALLLVPFSLFVAGFLGRHIGDYLFYRDLPRMEKVVALIQDGSIPVTKGRIKLPSRFQDLAYSTQARKDEKGVLTVIFFVGGGFPVKHQCYLYRSNGVLADDIKKDWTGGFRREKQWFEVHD